MVDYSSQIFEKNREGDYSVTCIGLSMRVIKHTDYPETRDAIAHDWFDFMEFAIPEIKWFLIPNLKGKVHDYIDKTGIDGFILTGGEDIGICEERDETENQIMAYAVSQNYPVFGVCRGFQFINSYFNGTIEQLSGSGHGNGQHPVKFLMEDTCFNKTERVNSYHNMTVKVKQLSPYLCPLAISDDNVVEAFYSERYRTAGLQWHPERDKPYRNTDKKFMRRFFGFSD